MSQSLKDTILEIINEKQLEAFAPYVKRNISVSLIPRKAQAIIGVRRSGKTTFLKQIWDEFESSLKNCAQFYLNFSDDRISDLMTKDLALIMEVIDEINAELEKSQLILYLDEIQLIKGWEIFVDRILRRKNTFVFLSGSSAKLLSKDIATEMRGRSISIEIAPFSFDEYLHMKNIKTNISLRTSAHRIKIEKELNLFMERGGFPEVIKSNKITSTLILQEYLHSIFYRDIVERNNVSEPNRLLYLLKSLIQQSASPYTINRLTDKMRSLNYHIDKSTVSNAVQWFQDAFCLFSISLFSESIQKQNSNPKKIYSVDNGLIQAIKTISIDRGHLLENIIYQKLRHLTKDPIFYYKTKEGYEIDFYTPSFESRCIQVCYDLSNEEVQKRELRALKSAQKELGIKKVLLISHLLPNTNIIGDSIEIVPAWKFLLKK